MRTKSMDFSSKLELRKKGLLGFVVGSKTSTELDSIRRISVHAVHMGAVSQNEINRLPKRLSPRDQMWLAQTLAAFPSAYSSFIEEAEQRLGKRSDYMLGAIMADFLEVIPRSIATRILYSASNPEIAEDIFKGRSSISFWRDTDTQALVIESLVLLPAEVRKEVFKEMTKLEPKLEGRAHSLFRMLVANFHQKSSPYCGRDYIYANLPSPYAETKEEEVQGGF